MKVQSTSPRLRVALLSAAFLVLAAAGTPAFGQATTTTTNEEVPLSTTEPNPCNGDVVAIQGTMHVTNTLTLDASGGYHLKSHVNYQDVSGTVALNGRTYRVSTTANETVNDSDSAQFETTVIQTIKLISQGPVPNFFVQVVFHITVNANGQTTSTVTDVRSECRGAF